MADSVQLVPYYSVTLPNKTGQGIAVLATIRAAGVNLIGFWGYPVKGRKVQFDLVPEKPADLARALKKASIEASARKQALLVSGADRPGALADSFSRLAGAGVDVYAAQAIAAGEGRYACLLQLADADIKKAKKALS
jgi:hypothetical protein